jgi:hypothetical protein
MRPLTMAVGPVTRNTDFDRPSVSLSRLVIRQTPRRASLTPAPPLRSRSAPSVDTAGEDDYAPSISPDTLSGSELRACPVTWLEGPHERMPRFRKLAYGKP